jgi:hypothetical protein
MFPHYPRSLLLDDADAYVAGQEFASFIWEVQLNAAHNS